MFSGRDNLAGALQNKQRGNISFEFSFLAFCLLKVQSNCNH